MRRGPRLGVAAAAVLAGCGLNTTTKSGEAGDTLSAGGLRVTLIRFDNEVPRKEGGDVTGLGTPTAGNRFFGVDVKVCNDRGDAIGTFDFGMKVDGGQARARFPQTVYADAFESVRNGCESGWMVFEAPKASSATRLTFKYDNTGSGGPSGESEKHARFSWKL